MFKGRAVRKACQSPQMPAARSAPVAIKRSKPKPTPWVRVRLEYGGKLYEAAIARSTAQEMAASDGFKARRFEVLGDAVASAPWSSVAVLELDEANPAGAGGVGRGQDLHQSATTRTLQHGLSANSKTATRRDPRSVAHRTQFRCAE